MKNTLILTGKEVGPLLRMDEVISAVEGAFLACGRGSAKMPPKTYLETEEGDFRAMLV